MRYVNHLALLAAGAQLACSPSPAPPRSDDAAAVRRAGEAYLAALRTNNTDSILAHWGDTATVLPPNDTILRDRAALRTWADAFVRQLRVVDARFSESEVMVDGDLATERVAFALTLQPVAGGAPVTEVGKGLHVYRRGPDGTWKLRLDIWNADAPPRP